MITLKTPIAQAPKKISPSPLWEELSDESAASCGGGNTRELIFAVAGGKIFFNRYVPASWSDQQVYNYVAHVYKSLPAKCRTHVNWIR